MKDQDRAESRTRMQKVPLSRLSRSRNHLDQNQNLRGNGLPMGNEDVHDKLNLWQGDDHVNAAVLFKTEERSLRLSPQQLKAMVARAQVFRVHRVIDIARRSLRDMHDQFIVLQSMTVAAYNYDNHTLIHQAFEQWRACFVARRRSAEKEKYYSVLNTRAEQARDMFLMTKALTHWAQSAADESKRSTAARARVVQTRCLRAWRDITVTNELKVQHFTLSNTLRLWRRQAMRGAQSQLQAKQFLSHSLLLQGYRTWFWHFCDRRAPVWHDAKLKHKCFTTWLRAGHEQMSANLRADSADETKLLRNSFGSWYHRNRYSTERSAEARTIYNRNQLRHTWQAVHRAGVLLSKQTQIQQLILTHHVRQCLFQWLHRVRASLEARRVDVSRISRNVWTLWNDRLRCQALSRNVDDRVMMQVLYQWILAERLKLYARLQATRLRRRTLLLWHTRTDELCSHLGAVQFSVEQMCASHTLVARFQHWSSQARVYVASEALACHFRNRHMLIRILSSWTARHQELQRMQSWATDARYFVLSTGTFRAWRKVVDVRRRRKRRDAYALMRRKTKMAVARRVLVAWQIASARLKDTEAEALRMAERNELRAQGKTLTVWHNRLLSNAADAQSARGLAESRALQNALTMVRSRHQQLVALDKQADVFQTQVVDTAALSALRSINWRLFQIKRQQETGNSLEQRNCRKHYRNMMRYWADRSAKQSNGSQTDLFRRSARAAAPRSSQQRVNSSSDHFRLGQELEHSSVAPDTEERSFLVHTPGYLRTPSRRTTRSRTRFTAGATPARAQMETQITPFMNRLLNIRTPGVHVGSPRGDFTRGLLANERTIDDIQEASPVGPDLRLD